MKLKTLYTTYSYALIKSKPMWRIKMNKIFYTLLTLALASQMFISSQVSGCDSVNVNVNGLVCDFCARSIEKVFLREDAVSSISVDLDKGKIGIVMKQSQSLDDSVIEELIVNSGFNLVSIHRCDS